MTTTGRFHSIRESEGVCCLHWEVVRSSKQRRCSPGMSTAPDPFICSSIFLINLTGCDYFCGIGDALNLIRYLISTWRPTPSTCIYIYIAKQQNPCRPNIESRRPELNAHTSRPMRSHASCASITLNSLHSEIQDFETFKIYTLV
jgi:hypothetical protein